MRILFTAGFILSSLVSSAQFRESFFALDSNWRQTDEQHAKYLLWIHIDSANNWEYNYYHMWGPMIKQESYKDHDGKVRNGVFTYYYTSGNLDSIAHYTEDKKDGKFIRYAFLPNDSLAKMAEYDYVNDSLVNTKNYKNNPQKDTAVILPAQYPGGLPSWTQYLAKSLHYPDRAISEEIQGTVRIRFVVDERGNVLEPLISKSVEYSLDREALRVVAGSGNWLPAIMNAQPISSEFVQAIPFKLEVAK
ncbi:MAG TPA: energy transducer TonB [Puia sp.]|nr:energy transducer TonB [Puia sp.]